MRVISGKYKGKKLDGFGIVGTRPTMDRVKESLFASIQNRVFDSIVLDLFAGSGALGIEALSNGAKEAYFVDSGREIGKVLQKNLVGIENYHLLLLDYKEALKKLQQSNILFDIVFLDPPYHSNLLKGALEELRNAKVLKDKCLLVCEYEEETPNIDGEIFVILKTKRYGDKVITIYEYRNI